MFSSFFIKRPVFASVVSIIIVMAGMMAMINLPIEQYPRVVPPQITVSAVYPGASADTLAKTVAAPIEEQINGATDMIYMNSVSEDSGMVSINVYFKVGTNARDAKIDVNNRVQAALSKLPEQVQRQGVVVSENSPSMLQVIMLYSPNKTHDVTFLSNYALMNIVDDLKRVDGIGDAIIFGAKDYAIRIWIDPLKLAKYNLVTTDLINAIKEQNNQYAAGKIAEEPIANKQMFTYTIQTPARLSDPREFGEIIVRAQNDGSVLRLKDVATIELGSQKYNMTTKLNNAPAIPIALFLQSEANALETAQAIEKVLEKSSKNFPEDLTYKIPYDSTKFVEISIQEVVKTFAEAILLVMLIIFLFLQNWRATLIPILAVPVSIIGTFAGMYMFGFSINLLTLFGLVLAIGIVVDDAIIVIENVERHMSEGMNPKDASFKAMGEVSSALIAIVLVLSAVFIPVAFMGGLTGEMYKQFAITIVISIVISGFVALTLTPSLCAGLLKPTHTQPARFFVWFNTLFESATKGYSYLVRQTIRYSFLSVFLFGVLIFVSYDMFKSLKTGLVPQEDQGTIFLFNYNPPGASLSRTEALTDEINKIVMKDPNVEDIITLAGLDFATFSERTFAAATIVKLKPWDERMEPDQHAEAILKRLNMQAMGTSDGFSFGVLPPPIMGMSIAGGFEMYVQDRSGGDPKELAKYVQMIIESASKRPELMGMRTTLDPNIPQYKMSVDIPKAKAKGIAIGDIYTSTNANLGSFYVNDFTFYGRNYKVNMQGESNYRQDIDDLKNIFVKNNKGELYPIDSFVHIEQTIGTDLVERFNLFQAANIAGQPAFGYSSGDALRAIEEVAAEILPPSYTISWVGTAYQEKQLSSSSSQAFILGIVLLFLILAAQYGRWLLPLSVLMAVPFAIFGAILATGLRGLENDIYFQIGLLVLAGLAAKNAILIVEFALQKQKEGMGLAESAMEAAKIRLRPIVMTSMAFTLGVVPLALSSGAGAASRHSIGTGVIGGMLSATFLAIIFIPLFYILISKLSKNKEGLEKDNEIVSKIVH